METAEKEQVLSVNPVVLKRTSKQASVPRCQRQLLNASAEPIARLKTFRSIKDGGLSLVLIRILEFMVPCLGYELVLGIGWKKLDVWDIWPGSGTMNMRKTEMVFNHNHQITTRTNQSMSNYLDQLREQVTLKHMGVKEQKKQQPSALFGLPSIYDYITPNTKDSKE